MNILNMKSYTISVMNITQQHSTDRQIFVGKIKIKELLEPENSDRNIRFKIHQWKNDQTKEKGYQRAPDQVRIDKIKNYLQKEVENPIFPTAVLVTARNTLNFKEIQNSDFGKLTIDKTLYVIDGQHRIEAFKDIMQEKKLASSYSFMELPIIILSNFNYLEEVEQFFVINSRQRKIKTDLAQRIFLEISKNDTDTKLISEKNKWQMPAITIVDKLNEDYDVWGGLIGIPDDTKDMKKERVVTQNSFIKSLKPFFVGLNKKWDYSSGTCENGSKIVEECADLIHDYWNTIEEVYPKAFENKKNFALFKTVGVFSLHIVLAYYMNAHPELDRKGVISGVKELLETARDDNGLRTDFWKTGNKRSGGRGLNAGNYSSGSGHDKIAMSILHKKRITDF